MAIQVKHNFISGKSDGTDSTLVQPSHWNDQHAITMATGRLIGRATASAGVAEEIAIGTGLTLAVLAGVPTLSAGGASGEYTAAAGNERSIGWKTGTTLRWKFGVDTVAESGSNAGANFFLQRYDDAGTLIGTNFLLFTRSTGYLTGDGVAVAADFWKNQSKILTPTSVFAAAAPQTKAFAATINYNVQTDGLNIEFTATSAFTLANPTNIVAGMQGSIRIAQDATGSRAITYGTNWKKGATTDASLSTAANAVDYLFWYARSSSEIIFNLNKAVS